MRVPRATSFAIVMFLVGCGDSDSSPNRTSVQVVLASAQNPTGILSDEHDTLDALLRSTLRDLMVEDPPAWAVQASSLLQDRPR